ncbi:MAG: transcription-repair coupling factor [Betaproteobacteria bacterium]|nr:transcription-repair coupling factor [Betaproteobacteria bacterium]
MPHGSADAFYFSEAINQHQPLVIFTENVAHAQRLMEEIKWLKPEAGIYLFPDWETLPYDHFSPHPDLISERLATLWQFSQKQFDVALIPITTALNRLAPLAYLAARTFFIQRKQEFDRDAFQEQMLIAGYTHVTQVLRPGEYCVRGGLIDLFATGSVLPFRIELLDTEVESIRTFDADTQRTLYPVNDIRLLPAREFPMDESGRKMFRQRFRDRFEGDPSRSDLYKDISNGLAPGGVEYFLPLFFEEMASIFDYLPNTSLVYLCAEVSDSIQSFWQSVKPRWELLKGNRANPILDPHELFLSEEEFYKGLSAYQRIDVKLRTHVTQHNQPTLIHSEALPPLSVNRRESDPVKLLREFTQHFVGRVFIMAESLGRRESLLSLLNEHQLAIQSVQTWQEALLSPNQIVLLVGPIASGFIFVKEQIALITEAELFASQVKQSRRRGGSARSTDSLFKDLSEVKINDPVVHLDHGIGRFCGLVNLDFGEGVNEYMHLQYADEDVLYVPVTQLHLITRYTGGPQEQAPLHKLGSGQWQKAKKRAASRARDTAAELLDLYAKRLARQGFAFPVKDVDYDAFSAGFAFEETPDQLAAIEAVMNDMRSGKPMDRLVCGDVGFGKTEVAMRAAFLAVSAGKQVAILVPTTLLAEQHFNNFSDRFADWPVKIAELSRFRSSKEVAASLAGIEQGVVDIVIGTHKLISEGVKFANLGLVIIDEEHRFGVRQKERLKALRAEVDVLTLTATPIPRTLAMSLEGLRDFSVIATAPQKRLAIKTFVYPYSDSLVREAALRELKRGGQLYFLHNEVDTIENMRDHLTRLIPEARIAVAHGQLRERELEQVMRDFYHQQANILLCSTIIETGIDVPSANTILIHRADRFGLAQLHQLRGRVGRSHHQAYAYLLTPPSDALTSAAKKRLEAIQMMEELGSGFFLAMQDLEIRGAGEVLGDSQSGDMIEVGFSLYNDLLTQAVKALKKGDDWDLEAPLSVSTEINLHAPALLPSSYCGDVQERLVLYKRLSNCEDKETLDELRIELIDRFGLLPEPAQLLFDCHALRLMGQPLALQKIDANDESVVLQFGKETPLEPQDLILLLQRDGRYRLSGQDKLRVNRQSHSPLERVTHIKEVLEDLAKLVVKH